MVKDVSAEMEAKEAEMCAEARSEGKGKRREQLKARAARVALVFSHAVQYAIPS